MPEKDLDRLLLRNQLCFPLYACSREVIKQYRPFLDAVGLTYTQFVTMMVLWEHVSISVKELGGLLYLDSGTLTPVLKSLEAKGLLTRSRSAADERLLIVTLTNNGKALREKAAGIPEQVCACIRLAPEEAVELNRLLYKLLDAIG